MESHTLTYQAKMRTPIGVFFLAYFTAGIYYWYWYYKINEEAAILSGDDDANPALSLLAVTLGILLIIPFFVSHWRTAERVGKATGQPTGTAAQVILSVLLAPFAPLFYTWWVQGKLNKHGRRQRAAGARSVPTLA